MAMTAELVLEGEVSWAMFSKTAKLTNSYKIENVS